MAYYDPTKTYGGGAFFDFMDSGAKKQGQVQSAQLADWNAMYNDLVADMYARTGAMTDEELEAYKAEMAAQVEQDYKDNIANTNKLSLLNTVTNTVGILASGASFVGLGAAANAAKTATFATAISGASSTAGKVAAVAGTAALKLGGAVGGNFTARLAISAAPAIAAKLYTTNRTMEEGQKMQAAVNSMQATYEGLVDRDGVLTDQMRADTEEWRAGYEAGNQALLEAYEAGEMTQDEYNTAYEAFITEQEQKWAEYQAGHAEEAKYIVEHGMAYVADDYIADHGYDPDEVDKRCTTIAKLNEDNPNAYEAAKTRYETQQKLDTGSSFTNFIANMNAALLHYVPGFAYVEAAVIKVGDVVADFVANNVPVLSSIIPYEEKHKGESITEIAKSICSDAEARYELSHTDDQAEAVLRAGAEARSVEEAEAAVSAAKQPETPDIGPEPALA